MREEIIGDCRLILGDCREVLPTLGKVDAVVTDPPYFLPVQSYVGARGSEYQKRMLGDISVLQGYFQWLFEAISQNLANDGSWYVFCDAKSYPIFWRSMFPICKHVRLLIWDKMVSYNGYTWRHQHELIAWGEGEEAERIPTGDGDIIKCRGVLQKDRQHPAEKPVEVLRPLIAKTKAGGVVLDPFMGSGSTGVAAVKERRKYIGIETEPTHFDTACRRIEAALSDPLVHSKQAALI